MISSGLNQLFGNTPLEDPLQPTGILIDGRASMAAINPLLADCVQREWAELINGQMTIEGPQVTDDVLDRVDLVGRASVLDVPREGVLSEKAFAEFDDGEPTVASDLDISRAVSVADRLRDQLCVMRSAVGRLVWPQVDIAPSRYPCG